MRLRIPTWIIVVTCFATSAAADVQITLKKDWIRKYANTATISTRFSFDKAPKSIHRQKDDGEIHLAGRADEVKLPIVAEVSNARSIPNVLSYVQGLVDHDETQTVVGAWRFWCEHAGVDPQIQGEALEPFDTTNPEHVFEIHPIKSIAERDYASTFTPIEGYEPQDAREAFEKYENLRSRITQTKGTTTIRTGMAGYNFVKFQMRLREAPKATATDDGYFVMSKVETLDGELLIHKRRMVFLKDTPPAGRVSALRRGDCLVVLGMPRISLALVQWRTANAKNTKYQDVLSWNLPYEMIIVGAYDEPCADDE